MQPLRRFGQQSVDTRRKRRSPVKPSRPAILRFGWRRGSTARALQYAHPSRCQPTEMGCPGRCSFSKNSSFQDQQRPTRTKTAGRLRHVFSTAQANVSTISASNHLPMSLKFSAVQFSDAANDFGTARMDFVAASN